MHVGAPPEWQSRQAPFQVQPDTGSSFVDQNGYRVQSTPLLPLFRAVDALAEDDPEKEVEWGALDFITDRNNLRKLMRWLNDTEGDLKDFRIDLQLAGKKTVLVNRWEKRFKEAMHGNTFGFAFEKACTKPVFGCEKSTGHHRIIKYVSTQLLTGKIQRVLTFCKDMDGLALVVRFEVDACAPRPQLSTKPTGVGKARAASGNIDDLSDLLSGLKVSSTSITTTPSGSASATTSTPAR